MYARTLHLILVSLTREVLAGRLAQAPFTATLPTPDGPLTVTYPPAWPGALLPSFAQRLAAFTPEREAWDATVVERTTGTAVGQTGAKGGGVPDGAGDVEIGYGLNPDAWGRGYATEGVGELVRVLLARPEVRRVTAQTAVRNLASARVLEKLGFLPVGTAWDGDDGDLTVWARAR